LSNKAKRSTSVEPEKNMRLEREKQEAIKRREIAQ
jgi:hypothetical protein